MENEIKVNEYVRIAGGIIARITNKNKDGLLIDRVIRDPMRQDGTIRDWCIFNDEKALIVKHSPNLIDLIEVGDYVNGEIIDQIQNDRNPKLIWHLSSYGDDDMAFKNEDIETVATKEMMESISYKVKEIKNEKI